MSMLRSSVYCCRLLLSLLLVAVLVICMFTAAPVPGTRAAVYWGVYMDGVPWDMSRLRDFEASVGKPVSIVHFGQAWQLDTTMQPFPPRLFDTVREHGAIPMVNWGSWRLGYGSEQPDYRLREISSGRYDAYITQWARSAKAWGKPFFLKFNHEMNGWWQFPWAEQINSNQPGDYVKAWHHVHDIFTREGVTNATWVWCPNVASARSTPFATLYPGDAYVDWTCLHGYNFGGTEWHNFSQIFSGYVGNPYNSYQQLVNLAPSKPMMLGEWGSNEAGDGGVKKAAWIRDALAVQIPYNYPQIKAVVWFNWNSNPHGSVLIDSSAASLEAWRDAVAASIYGTNQFGTLTTSPIPVWARASIESHPFP